VAYTQRLLLAALLCAGAQPAAGQIPDSTTARQFERRDVMIPMRDGVRLFTVVLVPRQSAGPLPIILTRTPYGTGGWGGTYHMRVGYAELIRDGYVFVFQDIRGQHQSEGVFVMNRPPRYARDRASVDEATDTWDTIDWLLANVPNNGRVGMLGISYPGFLVNAAATDPHPALRALSPQATMGDAWMGDDFFHQGAFRQSYGIEWVWGVEGRAAGSGPRRTGRYDTYDWYLGFPTLDSLARAVGAMRWPTWQRFAQHPSYDGEWQRRAVPRYLTHSSIPTLTVGGWWDQEDMYGPQATYRALEATDTAGRNFLVVGPWYHGQWNDEAADSLGQIRFGRATGDDLRQLQARWFAYWLKDQGDGHFSEATVFDAGTNAWRTFERWPAPGTVSRQFYFHTNGRLSFDPPTEAAGSDTFVSDPAHPVPYRPRPIGSYVDWDTWLSRDQRFVHGRPDVLTWETEPLTRDVTVAGDIVATLFASTTGTDADWVVKVIDVYPDSVPGRPAMGGYQLMIAGDIMRGRYRRSFERPEPIPAGTVLPFTVDLHQQAYTFTQGHRIMVQVQSTWFPLYDRNPQTFVANIFAAKPEDYRARTHRIVRSRTQPSHVAMTVFP